MANLRKMLGDPQSDVCVSLMRLMETQSAKTLAAWSIGYAKEHYLTIYEQACPGQPRLREIVAACEVYLNGGRKLAEVKPDIKEAAQIGRNAGDAVAQAAARAIATACAVIQTPTSALGFLLYGAAATAYSEAGLTQTADVYDELAAAELNQALDSLRRAAIPDEAYPAKINWNC